MIEKQIPNPESNILAKAVVGGAGIGLPPYYEIPDGMAAVILLVPMNEIVGKNPIEIQADLGIPWSMDGEPYWFEKELDLK